MDDAIRLFAGDCTVTYQGESETCQRGTVLTLVKPDNTVLVHDADGYQPAAWLTRAQSVDVSGDGTAFHLDARSDGTVLTIQSHHTDARTNVAVSPAGSAVGVCPDCEYTIIRSAGAVVCTGCFSRWGVPRDASVTDATCSECGLPKITVERGAAFQICVDYACDPLAAAVAERFDGAWVCPDCLSPMAVRRSGSLEAVCEKCGVGHPIPAGSHVGTCACGLPEFETTRGLRCLDPGCEDDPEEPSDEAAP